MASSGQQPAASSASREARADRLPPAGANPTGAAGADHSPLRGVAVGHGKLPDCQLFDYGGIDSDSVKELDDFVSWARGNRDKADAIFRTIQASAAAGAAPVRKDDPSRRQIGPEGNDKVTAYPKNRALQAALRKAFMPALGCEQKTDWSAYALVALLRKGKGRGNAKGSQQWHTDVPPEVCEQLAEKDADLLLCIGTVDCETRVRVINTDGDYEDVVLPPYHLLLFPSDLVHCGLDFEDDNVAFHCVLGNRCLGRMLAEGDDLLEHTNPITHEAPPLAAAEMRRLQEHWDRYPMIHTYCNGTASLNGIFFPHGHDDSRDVAKWCEGNKPTFARYRQHAPDFADPDDLYARLLRVRQGLPRGQECATTSAFQALYKENPGLVKMHEWIITVCSARKTGGNGFLELDNEAAGNLDEGQDYSLEAVQITQRGLCPFRRGGHPEYEQAKGYYLDSRYIRNDECPVLALANAAGEDFVEGGLAAIRRECGLADGEYPEMGHLAGYVDKHTPLALIECKGTGERIIPGTKTPLPGLTGNLQGLLMQTRHMFLLETIWPGKRLKHLMVYDAERKFLCMGRCSSSLKQTTLRVTENDMYNPAGGLREFDDGFNFTVGKVSIILVKTSRLNEVPLAALCDAELRARKDAKRKAWEMTATDGAEPTATAAGQPGVPGTELAWPSGGQSTVTGAAGGQSAPAAAAGGASIGGEQLDAASPPRLLGPVVYEGEKDAEGRWHGQGTAVYEGEKWTGEFVRGVIVNGTHSKPSRTYTGEFGAGFKYHGKGVRETPGQSTVRLEGNWRNGFAVGLMHRTLPSGNTIKQCYFVDKPHNRRKPFDPMLQDHNGKTAWYAGLPGNEHGKLTALEDGQYTFACQTAMATKTLQEYEASEAVKAHERRNAASVLREVDWRVSSEKWTGEFPPRSDGAAKRAAGGGGKRGRV